MSDIKIRKALISVFNKDGLEPVIHCLREQGVELLSTGGTHDFITQMGIPCTTVEDVTNYPSILGGRVKTLHPAIFGGILARRGHKEDQRHCEIYEISPIDLVIVDLYPFRETITDGGSHEAIIEKIDIGGVSLIRAAAKNYKDVVVVPSRHYYAQLLELLRSQSGCTKVDQRQRFAREAFMHTAAYDAAVNAYFRSLEQEELFSPEGMILEYDKGMPLRYGENPHQQAILYGNAFHERFTILHGKQLSYNNLLDVDAATHLIEEFEEPAAAIMKHNTPCGLAERPTIREAYVAALECDPVSAFGGIVVLNRPVDLGTAEELHKLFIEVLIAPDYTPEALDILMQKKNRIIVQDAIGKDTTRLSYRTILGGLLAQERDNYIEHEQDLRIVTKAEPSSDEVQGMLFGMKAVKYCKSNAIVLARGPQILGAGYGQTSRVDALKQAIEKARAMGFDLRGAVMASDAFFPFADCVAIAHEAGITAVIQPGGSVKDQDSIDACDRMGMSMVMTGVRHFRH